MSKLLAADFVRLKKSKVFWSSLIFVACWTVFLYTCTYWQSIKNNFILKPLEHYFFDILPYSFIIAAIFCSLFVGMDYTDGTIRNKLICGRSRIEVYLSNVIVCSAGALFILAAYTVVSLSVGIPLMGFFQTKITIVLLYIFLTCLTLIAACAVFVLPAMLYHNRAANAVISIVLAFFLLFAGAYIDNRLIEPEMVDRYIVITADGIPEQVEPYPNPLYLKEGPKRQVYEWLDDILPTGQALQMADLRGERAHRWPFCSAAVTVLVSGSGIALFRRQDIK